MTSRDDERAFWDREAVGDAAHAVWGTDDWDTGVAHCLYEIVPAIGSALTPGARILDLGCGIGRLTEPVARLCPDAEIVGVDLSANMIGLACQSESRPANTTYLIGDGRTIGGLGMFDAAYSVLCFQHLDDPTVRAYIWELGHQSDLAVLQWTVGEYDGEFHHNRSEAWMRDTAETVFTSTEVHSDPSYETWRWLLARA